MTDSTKQLEERKQRSAKQSVCIAFARGCPRNEMDTAMLFQYFKENGWESAKGVEQADLSVVATCGFDEGNRRESLRLLSLVDKRRKKGSKLVVVGCLPGIEPDVLHKEFNAETVGPADINRLDEIVGGASHCRKSSPSTIPPR